jgi:hypothetical protein
MNTKLTLDRNVNMYRGKDKDMNMKMIMDMNWT